MDKVMTFTALFVLLVLGVGAWDDDYMKEQEDSCDCSCGPSVRVMANNVQKVRYEDPPPPSPHHKPQPPKQLMCDMHYELVTWEGGATCYLHLDASRYMVYEHNDAKMYCEDYFYGHLATYDTVQEFGAFKKWWASKKFPYIYGKGTIVYVGGYREDGSTHFHKPNGDDYNNLGILSAVGLNKDSGDSECITFVEDQGVLFLQIQYCFFEEVVGGVCEQSPKYRDDFADHSYEAMYVDHAKQQAYYK